VFLSVDNSICELEGRTTREKHSSILIVERRPKKTTRRFNDKEIKRIDRDLKEVIKRQTER